MDKNYLRRFNDQFSADSVKQKDQVIQQLQLLMDITRKVASYDILDDAFKMLEHIIATSVHSEMARIYTYLPADSELYRRVSRNEENDVSHVRNVFNEVDDCFISGDATIINHPQCEYFGDLKVRNFACSLIQSTKGEKLGVVQIINKENADYDDADLKQLATLGHHLGVTLENALRNEQAVQTHEEEMELLNFVAEVTTNLDLISMINKIIMETIRFLRAERATVFLFDESTNELFSHVGIGLGGQEIRFPANVGIAGEVFTNQSTINIPYAYADLRFSPVADEKTGFFTRSILCVPLINTKGKCIGVTQVLNKRGGVFSQEDETRLKAFTTQIAVGIENAKLFNDIQNIKNYTESMLQSISNAVITFDGDNNIITCNHAAEILFAIKDVEDCHLPLDNFIPHENDWLVEAIEKVNLSRESYSTAESELIINDKPSSVNIHIHPLVSVEGDNLGTVLMLEDITTEKRLKTTMARYMDPSIADQLLEDAETKLGGQAVKATILFSDIRKFTTISEKLGPQNTVSFLNHFFTEMVSCIQKESGMVNKFIGDAVLAVYGVPLPLENEADKALKSAIAMWAAVDVLNQEKSSQLGGQTIEIGIGINTDSIVYGNIGSPKRMDFTVIGNGVNLASRIEGACKHYNCRILISQNTYKALKGTYRLREIDKVILKGNIKPILLYQVLDCYSDNEFPNMLDVVQLTREGLKYYHQQDWSNALHQFNEILRLHPSDRIAALYIERCQLYQQESPGSDWDGVWQLTEK